MDAFLLIVGQTVVKVEPATDHLGAILAFTGAIAAVLITWYATNKRQQK